MELLRAGLTVETQHLAQSHLPAAVAVVAQVPHKLQVMADQVAVLALVVLVRAQPEMAIPHR